jgi:tetratricopeptide (TPR) repeat protein
LTDWAGAYIADDTSLQIKHLQLALEYSKHNNVLRYTLARTKYLLKDYDGTIEAVLPTVEMKWQFSPAYYLLALSYHQLKYFEKSREVLTQALSLHWIYWDIYSLLSVYALRDKDTAKARDYERKYLQSARAFGLPEDLQYASLGENNLSEGYYRNAFYYYELSARLRPENPHYHRYLGDASLHLGDREEAEQEFCTSLRLDSTQTELYFTLAEMHQSAGKTSNALLYYTLYLTHDSLGSKALLARQRVLELGR